jgi:hypothetical protein
MFSGIKKLIPDGYTSKAGKNQLLLLYYCENSEKKWYFIFPGPPSGGVPAERALFRFPWGRKLPAKALLKDAQ